MDIALDYLQLSKYRDKLRFNVIDPILTLYSRCFWRILFALSLFYALIFLKFEPIKCNVFSSKIQEDFVKDMCIQGYYRAEKPYLHVTDTLDGKNPVVQYDYYAWIFLLILFQALLCWLPWLYLRSAESYKLNQLEELNRILYGCQHVSYRQHVDYQKKIKAKYRLQLKRDELLYIEHVLLDQNNIRFIVNYILAYGIAVATLLAQIYFLHHVFNRRYMDFGLRLLKHWLTKPHSDFGENPVQEIFPFLVACRFRNIGFSGTIQFIDSLCVFKYNLVNAYIYTILWFIYWALLAALLFTIATRLLWLMAVRFTRMSATFANKMKNALGDFSPDKEYKAGPLQSTYYLFQLISVDEHDVLRRFRQLLQELHDLENKTN